MSTDLTTALIINEQVTDPEDERDHIVCCDDENLGLCGVDLTGVPWVDSDDDKRCADCVRIEAYDEGGDSCVLCPLVALRSAAS